MFRAISFPHPKFQNVFVVELALVYHAVPSAGTIDEGFANGVSFVSQAQQRLSVGVFIIGVGKWHARYEFGICL
jgi:hypothetical protein